MFKPLTRDNIGGIMKLILDDVNARLAEREITIALTDEASDLIVEKAYDPVYGARPLKRFMQRTVETLAARKILEGNIREGDTITIGVAGDELTAL